jgi:hypothetical protein
MVLSEKNKVVHGLWVGNKLSSLELLTIHSFVECGHEFHLWTYNQLDNQLPENVIIKDANEIIPEAEIFRRNYNDPVHKIGKGSVGSPFSDLFRYKLLYEYGGWWVDMDVTCLKPLNIDSDYFFRGHALLPSIGNVMKVPAKSELMKRTYLEVEATCNADTLEWLLPNKILNKHISELQLSKFISNELSVDDWWEKIEIYLWTTRKMPESWFFIHWMNEEWRIRKIDKNKIYKNTTIGKLFEQYRLTSVNLTILTKTYIYFKGLFLLKKYNKLI